MKKIISIVLLAALCLCLAACGKTQAAKDWETSVAAIGEDINYDSAPAIAQARREYEALTDEEKKSVDLENFETKEKTFFELPASPLKSAEYLKSKMKDPTSFRLYGDIFFAEFDNDEGELIGYVAQIGCAAKNGYGAYGGEEMYDVIVLADGSVTIVSDDDSTYLDFTGFVPQGEISMTSEEHGMKITVFDGQHIADLMGCEYFD